ncbi:MAG: response regulator [Terriglobales bacterium]
MKGSTPSPRLPILVIEDEPSVMAFVRAALERSGYTVVPAETGAQALLLLRANSFSGVISDMRTPGGVDGADVWEWIGQHRPDLLSKVIFITGDIVNEETAATLRRTGAPYVEKPFRVQQLMAMVEQFLGVSPS